MFAYSDPEQYKQETQFSIFSGSPKPNSDVAELAKVIKKALLKQGYKPEAAKPLGIAPFSAKVIKEDSYFPRPVLDRILTSTFN